MTLPFPSPLAGEGQGEGDIKTRERSEHHQLKTQNFSDCSETIAANTSWLIMVGKRVNFRVRVIAGHQVKGPKVNLGAEWAQGFFAAITKKPTTVK